MLASDDNGLPVCVSRTGLVPDSVWPLFAGTSFCLWGTSLTDCDNLGQSSHYFVRDLNFRDGLVSTMIFMKSLYMLTSLGV